MRTTITVPRPVLDRMGYANPLIVRDWSKIFSKKSVPVTMPRPMKKVRARKNTPEALVKPKGTPKQTDFILNRRENPTDFERMSFVLKARSKDETRPHLAVLHVEQTSTGSRLIATDGLRLHVAEIGKKIPGGNYKPVVTKDSISFGKPVEGITFVNWVGVIPANTRRRGIGKRNAGL